MGLSSRNLVAIGVLLAWGAAIGWLMVRRTGQSESTLLRTEAALRLAPGDAWFEIRAGELPVGIAGITLDTTESGYRIRETVTLSRPVGPAIERVNRTTEYLMGPDLSLIQLDSRDGVQGQRRLLQLRGGAQGWAATLLHDNRVVAQGTAAGTLAAPVLLAPYRLALTGALARGDGRTFATLGGWPPSTGPARYTVGSDTLVVFADSSELHDPRVGWQPVHFDSAASRTVVINSAAGPLLLQADRRGTITGLRYPFGLQWVRTDFDLAHHNPPADSEAVVAAAIRNRLPVVRRWAGSALARLPALDSLTYRVTRRDGSRVGGTLVRHFVSDGVSYRAERRDGRAIGDLLHVGPAAPRRLPGDDRVTDPFVQTDNARIVAFADSFRTADGAVRFDELRARFARFMVDTGPSGAIDAVGTLTAGGGTPDGLARLLAAVLGGQGGRARLVIGVAARADTLYSHAWVEYWVDADHRWVAIDPLTLRPSSARLIRLAAAGSSDPEELLPRIADVRFEPVDTVHPLSPPGTSP